MHPILFVQVYLFLVLPTSFLISYEYYNLGWNSMLHYTQAQTGKARDICSYCFSLYLDMLYLAYVMFITNGFK